MSKTKSHKETKRIFYKYVLPHWEHRAITSITTADVSALLDHVEDKHGLYMANRTLAAIRKLYNWAVSRGGYVLHGVPVVPGMARKGEAKRERVLSDPEIKAIWLALKKETYPFGPLLQLLMLTGLRRNEVSGMRWSEIDIEKEIWSIPGERNKSSRPHTVPLSAETIKIITELPRLHDSDLVFTTTGKTPVSGFGRAKKRIDEDSDTTDWRIHDIRRTVGTQLGSLGVSRFHIGRILNHADQSVTGRYDQHQYDDVKKQALELWEKRLVEIITGENSTASNVTSIQDLIQKRSAEDRNA